MGFDLIKDVFAPFVEDVVAPLARATTPMLQTFAGVGMFGGAAFDPAYAKAAGYSLQRPGTSGYVIPPTPPSDFQTYLLGKKKPQVGTGTILLLGGAAVAAFILFSKK